MATFASSEGREQIVAIVEAPLKDEIQLADGVG